ncbi:putative ABC transporter ATP-binding protein [Paenibacillus sp. FSL R7-269]|uniref:hypothetical protein n=1 Tax=Paenibacillus sp. FSL R7-269 TaxID=1226755 RepID=UPI0003E2380C|nr:hypothetical protein [Paenibacillus sp. FSL R7-269]ETT32902.1 putative ABC transporter ATP-binding protein [Paenibacillus sp. FSL R7-269]
MVISRIQVLIFSTHILQLATDLCDELVVLQRGKLTRVSVELLKQPDVEQQVIELLSEEDASEPGIGKEDAYAGDA